MVGGGREVEGPPLVPFVHKARLGFDYVSDLVKVKWPATSQNINRCIIRVQPVAGLGHEQLAHL